MSASPISCLSSDDLEGIAVGRETTPAIQDHLAACDACRSALERIRDDNSFLSRFAVGGALPTVAITDSAHEIEIPGYRIVREIHRGGQGVVYQAVQESTKRDVAVKVMKQGPFATLADRARFDREIETLARLEHPSIIAVHDAGVVAGFHYFVMNYVDGKPLDEAIADFGFPISQDGGSNEPIARRVGERITPAEESSTSRTAAVLNLFIKICDAVHAAHLRGIVHRDLKPSNIRIDRDGEPHVLDFGLAKSTDSPPDSVMTQTGQFVGSLPWASPEQIEGEPSRIDLRTDVYSLGAILFQLLTGRLPFDVGSGLRDAFENILNREPTRPSAVIAAAGGPRIDDELDTIILKCLSKDRDRRYQSAGELARDLRRYLAGKPIEAKSDSAMYVLRKTLRRYRLRVAVACAFVVLLGVFGFVMALLYRHSSRLEHEAVRSAASLSDMLSRSNIEQGRMAGMLGNIDEAERLLWHELLMHREGGDDSTLRLNDPPGPPEAYWGLWTLYRTHPCLRTLTPQPATIRIATLADDGRNLWTADPDGLVRKIDPFGATLDSYRVTFRNARGFPTVDASGKMLFNYDGNGHALWRRGAGERPLMELSGLPYVGYGNSCISRSGNQFAAVIDGTATVWNADPLGEVARFTVENAALTAAAFSNDEKRLAARDRVGGLHIWEIESKRRVTDVHIPMPRDPTHDVGELLFSPDDRRIADAWMEIGGRIWDLRVDPPRCIDLSERPGNYGIQSFSPDGRLLAIGDMGGVLRTFDAATGTRRTAWVAHAGRVRSIAFTRDGRGIWTCGEGDLRLWEVAEGGGVRTLRINDEGFHSVDFSPDGRRLAAGGGLGRLYRIDATTLAVTGTDVENRQAIPCVAFTPDGRGIAVATYANDVHLWDERNPDCPPVWLVHPNKLSHLCFSSDGARIATACDDWIVRVWRTSDGTLERALPRCDNRVPQVAFDPTGRRLAAAVRSGALLVWNLDTGECETWSNSAQNPLRAVRYSPDGRRLVAGGADRSLEIWDTSLRKCVDKLVGHNQEIYCIDLSARGDLIASGDSGGVIRLWHAALRRPLATLDGHAGAVMAVRFAPDGRSLVSASLDGTLRVWDLTYFARHVAGNLETQLLRMGADKIDAARAAAWRRWRESESNAAAESASRPVP